MSSLPLRKSPLPNTNISWELTKSSLFRFYHSNSYSQSSGTEKLFSKEKPMEKGRQMRTVFGKVVARFQEYRFLPVECDSQSQVKKKKHVTVQVVRALRCICTVRPVWFLVLFRINFLERDLQVVNLLAQTTWIFTCFLFSINFTYTALFVPERLSSRKQDQFFRTNLHKNWPILPKFSTEANIGGYPEWKKVVKKSVFQILAILGTEVNVL